MGEEAGHPFRGNQWVAGSGAANFSHALDVGVQAVKVRTPEEAKQAAKDAHAALKGAGFVKGESSSEYHASARMGRSMAFSGSSRNKETSYSHPKTGITARLIERVPKYGDKEVAVHVAYPPGLVGHYKGGVFHETGRYVGKDFQPYSPSVPRPEFSISATSAPAGSWRANPAKGG